jgi:hypothetical protein
MWPKTLYSVRGNVSVRVWSQDQIARLGSTWELREPPEVAPKPEPEITPEPVLARPRGRPRKG